MAHWQLGSRKRKSFGNGKFAGLTDPIDPMPQISPDWENFVVSVRACCAEINEGVFACWKWGRMSALFASIEFQFIFRKYLKILPGSREAQLGTPARA